jgi:hypothetical protein
VPEAGHAAYHETEALSVEALCVKRWGVERPH